MLWFESMTEAQYVTSGKRHEPEAVGVEAADTAERWMRDLAVLSDYGLGPKLLARFRGLIEDHRKLRIARPKSVAARSAAVEARNALGREGSELVDQATAVLSFLALDDSAVAGALRAARPRTDAALESSLYALADLLEVHGPRIEDELDIPGLVGRMRDVASRIKITGSKATAAREAQPADTQALDALNGRLAAFITRVNKAGRKAFRALGDEDRARRYRYHRLRSAPHRKSATTSAPTETTTPA